MHPALLAPLDALQRTARNRSLARVQVAWALFMTGSWAATVGLSVVAYADGGSAAVGLAVLARTVPGAVVGLAVGAVVDRASPRGCLLVSAAVAGAGSAAAAMAGERLVLVVALLTAVSLATILFRTAQSAVVPSLVEEPAELTAANALSSAVESASVFAGPALAALLLALEGPGLCFGAAALLSAAAALAISPLPRSARAQAAAASGPPVAGRTADVLRQPTARLVLLLLLAQTLLSGGLVVLYPALAEQALEADGSAVGLLTAAFGLGGLLGSLGLFALAGSSRLGLLTSVALALWWLPLLALPLVPGLVTAMLVVAVVGAGNVLFDVTSVTLLQRALPGHLLGRAFGVLETVVVVGAGLGAAAAPSLDTAVGPAQAVVLLCCPLAVATAVTVRSLRALDRDLAAPARQVALLRALPEFALLAPLQVERLALRLRRIELAPGEVVVAEGEQGSTWYAVDAGELAVSVTGRLLRLLSEGEAFGEIALVRRSPRTATVVAATPAAVWALDGEVFLAALRADGGHALSSVDAVVDAHLQDAARRTAEPGSSRCR